MLSFVSRFIVILGIIWFAAISTMLVSGTRLSDEHIMIVQVRDAAGIRPYAVDMRTGAAGFITLQPQNPATNDFPYTTRTSTNNREIILTLLNEATSETIELTRYAPASAATGFFWSDDNTEGWAVFGGEDDTTRIQRFDVQGNLLADWQYNFKADVLYRVPNSDYLMLEGESFVFDRAIGLVREVRLVNLQTGDFIEMPRTLLNHTEWSPDGEWLFALYFDQPRERGHVGFMWYHPATGDNIVISHRMAGFFHEWSPTTEGLTYGIITDARTREREVYALNLNTLNRSLITALMVGTSPTFSEDGRVLITWENSHSDVPLYLTNMDTLETTTTTSIQPNADQVTIAPNGRQLVYILRERNDVFLHILNLQTGQSQPFVRLPQPILFVRWGK